MAGNKPVLRIVAKSKTTDNYASIAAFWDNQGRLGGQLDGEVSHIVFKDGREISNSNAWINVYDDREKQPVKVDSQPKSQGKQEAKKEYDAGDIPF